MYQWAWDGAQWVLVPIDRWEVGRGRGGGGRHHASHHAHRRAARAAQHMAAMQQQMTSSRKMAQPPGAMSPGTPTAGPPVGLQQHQTPLGAHFPSHSPPGQMQMQTPPAGGGGCGPHDIDMMCLDQSQTPPPQMAPPWIAQQQQPGGGWGWGGGPGGGGGPPGGGGGGGGDGQFVLWQVDVDDFGSFDQGMQVTGEQQISQGSMDDMTQQQSDRCTAVLPCMTPGGSGQVSIILPDGQKPSDQGWSSSGQPCASDPTAQNLEPVGILLPPQPDASTGWLPTAYGWMPYAPLPYRPYGYDAQYILVGQ